MAETPLDLLNANRLADAISATAELVRSRPAESKWRGLLAELYCLNGEYERADKQLDTLVAVDPGAAVGASLLRQLIRAATWRQDYCNAGRPPEILANPSDAIQLHLQLGIAQREGDVALAAKLVEEYNDRRPTFGGKIGEQEFADFRDADDSWMGVLEVFTPTGKYLWVPLDDVEYLDVSLPSAPRDLIWAPAEMRVHNGPEGQVYLPTIYPSTPADAALELRLGRENEWVEDAAGLTTGRGLRLFWVDETPKVIFQLQDVEFSRSFAQLD